MKEQEQSYEALGKARVKEVLVQARGLMARPYGWIKGASNRKGTRAPGGTSYCAIGSLMAATGHKGLNTQYTPEYLLARSALDKLTTSGSIVDFNDNKRTRKSDVLAAFDAAIKELSI